MKFAKELEQELVPEWRIKYLNYKVGKKHVKAVTRAISRVSAAPMPRRSGDHFGPRQTPRFSAMSPFAARRPQNNQENDNNENSDNNEHGELRGLTSAPIDGPQYGSITNPSHIRSTSVATDSRRTFELPDPAMRIPSNTELAQPAYIVRKGTVGSVAAHPKNVALYRTQSTVTFGQGAEVTPGHRLRRLFSVTSPQQWPGGNPDDINMRDLDEVREREVEFFGFLDSELDKVETFYKLKEEQAGARLTLLREQLHEMRNRRIDEIQRAKRRDENGGVSGFVSPGGSGDDEARSRVESRGSGSNAASEADNNNNNENKWDVHQEWIAPLKAKIFKPGPNTKALQKMAQTPRMLAAGGVGGGGGGPDPRRDYVRRPGGHDIPYRTAKHKLKLALQEFYRGLELLKSYALLNRTAFRKLNKKYDKAVHARPPYRYMTEKVNRSWFVNSTVVDDLIVATEDLYARYFERGNHKIAVGKLRALTKRPGDESGSAFRNGIMIGIGAVFAIQGTVNGADKLFDPDPLVRQQATYLLQIYGGYFLMLYLFTLFCIVCRVWTISKVNYPFIFEFDPRSHLDWRQLSQFPSFFFFVFGLFMWLNFSSASNATLYLYYPVILIGFTAVLLFFPAPTLWHRSRKWFLYSHWRLFFAGLYPVEFRDFFLGDIYCSLVYSVCNIELFFCLYAHAWNNPAQCNSNHSRLLGFFSTLPAIWRLLQCFRRYRDTRNAFPHLANGGKYTMTILSNVMLSMYRIDGSKGNLALFIVFSTLNSVYTSVWDLFMDFSLLQAGSRNFLLRDILALKSRWPYYVTMVIDPLLRCSWIFYAIFTHDTQHSSIVSFMVSFAEATRRGVWVLFRVENEHCANVAQYKASRDVPLPYHLHEAESYEQGQPLLCDNDEHATAAVGPGSMRRPTVGADGTPVATAAAGDANDLISGAASVRSHKQRPGTAGTSGSTEAWPNMTEGYQDASAAEEGQSTGAAVHHNANAGGSPSQAVMDAGTLRRRFTTTGRSIGIMMAEAHKQDFEKRRKPSMGMGVGGGGGGGMDVLSSPMGQPGAVDDLPSSDEDDHGDDGEGMAGDSGDSDGELELELEFAEAGGNSGGSGGGGGGGGGRYHDEVPTSPLTDRGGSSLRRASTRLTRQPTKM